MIYGCLDSIEHKKVQEHQISQQFFEQQKNQQVMCDMEVIITDTEYRELKLFQDLNKLNQKKLKELDNTILFYQQELKDNKQKHQLQKRQIKELSRNAMSLSRKVILVGDQVNLQEDKWIKREKQWLQRLIQAVKMKEQLEEGLKRERSCYHQRESQYGQKMDEMESKKRSMETDWKHLKNKLEKQNTQLKTQMKEILKKGESELLCWKKERQETNQKLACMLLENTGLTQDSAHKEETIVRLKVQLQELEVTKNYQIGQLSQSLQVLELAITPLKESNGNLKEQIRVQMEQKQNYKLALQTANLDMSKLRTKIEELETSLASLGKGKQRILDKMAVCKEKCKKSLGSDLAASIVELREQIKVLAAQNMFKMLQQKQEWTQMLSKIDGDLSLKKQATIKYVNENKELKSQIKELTAAIAGKLQQHQQQLSKLHKEKQHCEDQNILINQQLAKEKQITQTTLQTLSKTTNSSQLETSLLITQIDQMRREIVYYQRELEETKHSRNSQMTTEVIQLEQQALYPFQGGSQGGKHFKEDVDALWEEIQGFLTLKKHQLQSMQELRQLAEEIINQEFRLMMKRFAYLYEQRKTQFGLK